MVLHRELTDVELSFPDSIIDSIMPNFDPNSVPKGERKALQLRRQIEDRHKANNGYPNQVINSFCIREMDENDERRKQSPFMWSIKTGPQSRIQLNGAVHFPEPRSAFLRD
jgi:hypothetical protein